MKQSKTHQRVIQTKSEDQFTEFIHELGWEIDAPKNDYGEDFWIRVFDEGISTGDAFYVQLKGTDNIEQYLLKTEVTYSYSVDVEKLSQWSRSIIPVLIVLWDVEKRAGNWEYVQAFVAQRLKNNPKWIDDHDKYRQIHIPSQNIISIEDKESFIESVKPILLNQRSSLELGMRLAHILGKIPSYVVSALGEMERISLSPQAQHQARLTAIEIALNLTPSDVDAWKEKASIYYDLLDMEQAIFAINKAWEIDKSNLEIIWMRGSIFVEYANANRKEPKHLYHEAITLFNSVADQADPAILHYNLGNAYDGLREYEKAIEEFDLALSSKPPDDLAAQIWKNRGTCFFHLNNYREEIRSYRKALKHNPNLWEAYASWAATQLHNENFKEAHRLLLKAFKAYPYLETHGTPQIYSLAFSLWKLGKYTEAYQRVSQVLQNQPNYKDAIILKADILSYLWRNDTKYINDAIEFFNSMLLNEPTNIYFKGELYMLYEKKGEIQKAIRVLEEATREEDVPVRALYDYAKLLSGNGEYEKAIAQLERAVKVSQEHHIVHNLAIYKDKIGDYREAVQYYKLALIDTTHPIPILQSIGDCYFRLNEFENCVRIMVKLIQIDWMDSTWWGNLRFALLQLGLAPAAIVLNDIGERLFRGEAVSENEINNAIDKLFDLLPFEKEEAH
ncbi:MAG: tetratricopeptide repeat protein [Anaerolineae bacterium]|nr:tetratricopeptide repeat protein [Anaerolineae bacterium]